jgi:hypothetical protein
MEHYRITNQVKKKKIRYTSYKQASINANKFNSNIKNINKKSLYSYKCNICKGYHLRNSNANITKSSINKKLINIYSDVLLKVKFTVDLTLIHKKNINQNK